MVSLSLVGSVIGSDRSDAVGPQADRSSPAGGELAESARRLIPAARQVGSDPMAGRAAPWGNFAGDPPAEEVPTMLNDEQHAPWSHEVALRTIDAHAGQRGPLLPTLLTLQETFGYVARRPT
jgi:hypothetical protein